MNYLDRYNKWLDSDYVDEASKNELKSLTDDKEIEDRFCKNLEFGTAGLRGIVAAGTNRMNVYTVRKATQGLADYLLNNYTGNISVCISYDSRIMSAEFAEASASVLCANGIKAFLFESLRPVPMLSYAVRHMGSRAGIMITASHNPKQYNGYKVYGDDGGQITDEDAKEILAFINRIEDFSDIKTMNLKDAKANGIFAYIGEEVDKAYYEKVKKLTIRKELVKKHAENLKVIYTPLHGTGNIPIRTVLGELGYSNLHVVKEQEKPDGNFPTAPYPNPENKEVFDIAMKMAEKVKPDLIIGTDPDCDRIGIIADSGEGIYKPLTGNQTGVLLANYIISSLKEKGILKSDGFIVETIVTTKMAEKVAAAYGIKTIEVLTGFKYIGQAIKEIHDKGKGTFIFGFEESCGYLAGTFVRDKDAVTASMLVCEMALYYKTKGKNLFDVLESLYRKYGYHKEKLINIEMEGIEGQEKTKLIMQYLRDYVNYNIGGIKIAEKTDYMSDTSETNLPKSDVLKFVFEDGSSLVARPSGTEPKMKIYIFAAENSMEASDKKLALLEKAIMDMINKL